MSASGEPWGQEFTNAQGICNNMEGILTVLLSWPDKDTRAIGELFLASIPAGPGILITL